MQDVYVASIEEHSAAGAEIARVEATDADSGMYGEVSYAIPGELTRSGGMILSEFASSRCIASPKSIANASQAVEV